MFTRFVLAASALSLAACQSMAPVAAPAAPSAPAAAPAAPVVPQAWQQGRSAEQATSRLAPLAGKLTVTSASEIPLANIKLPAGFKAEI